jgi:hypothetical protein
MMRMFQSKSFCLLSDLSISPLSHLGTLHTHHSTVHADGHENTHGSGSLPLCSGILYTHTHKPPMCVCHRWHSGLCRVPSLTRWRARILVSTPRMCYRYLECVYTSFGDPNDCDQSYSYIWRLHALHFGAITVYYRMGPNCKNLPQ